jgi:dTDP-4-dehydrorhamnose 3,5-epimerase
MSKFDFRETSIKGVFLIEPKAFEDDRGFFMEYYNKAAFAENGFVDVFVQANHSSSRKGVVRGLHYQLHPHPMGKLIKVVKGKVFDVGVDLRKGSPTFGKWHGDLLSAANRKMLYFPPGFAHGFLALEDGTEVIYECTGMYDQSSERAVLWNDPDIGIKWPLEGIAEIILSDKDKKNPRLRDAETNFKI